jgi:hypothetical protein
LEDHVGIDASRTVSSRWVWRNDQRTDGRLEDLLYSVNGMQSDAGSRHVSIGRGAENLCLADPVQDDGSNHHAGHSIRPESRQRTRCLTPSLFPIKTRLPEKDRSNSDLTGERLCLVSHDFRIPEGFRIFRFKVRLSTCFRRMTGASLDNTDIRSEQPSPTEFPSSRQQRIANASKIR